MDDRCELDLVQVNQACYRLIQAAFGPQYKFVLADDGRPQAVQTWLVFYAVRIYGAADAALTLVLHNMSREAMILERQIFEYIVRARYLLRNPEVASLERETWHFRHLDMFEQMQTDKSSPLYQDVHADCEKLKVDKPDVFEYYTKHKNGPASIRQMVGPESDVACTAEYAANYSYPSSKLHGTTLSLTDVFGSRGVSFDSSTDDPNLVLVVLTGYLLNFLELIDAPLGLGIASQIADLRASFSAIEARHLAALQAE